MKKVKELAFSLSIKNSPKQLMCVALLFYLVFLVLLSTVLTHTYNTNKNSVIQSLALQEEKYLLKTETKIQDLYEEMIKDLRAFSTAYNIRTFLTNPSPAYSSIIEERFVNLVSIYQRYDQVRIINANGREVIRVNYRKSNAQLVAAKDLQEKSERDYFQKTIALNKGGIYISDVDLNQENGEIEIPVKSVVRMATPVYDLQDQKKGILILNAHLNELRRDFLEQSSSYKSMLINENGYWIFDADQNKELTNNFGKNDVAFFNEYKEAWKTISNKSNGFFTTNKGLFIFKEINPISKIGYFPKNISIKNFDAIKNNFKWKAIIFVSNDQLNSIISPSKYAYMAMGLVIAIFVMIILILAAYSLGQRRKRKALNELLLKQYKEQAQKDGLTGVNNSRYFRELAESEIAKTIRFKDPISLMMLDIDHFKLVNDHHGHLTGDLALKEFCRACENSIRDIDIFGRIGGEEFVILMPRTSLDDAKMVAERLREAVAKIKVQVPNQPSFGFTVSIGLVTELPDKTIDLENMLKKADQTLYEAKYKGRNQVCLFQQTE